MDQQAPRDSDLPVQAPADGTPQAAPAASRISRRRLLRAGAAGSPVLLSLASAPVSATSSCLVASSFVSASVWRSRNPGDNNITCIATTVDSLCTTAVNNWNHGSWNTVTNSTPQNDPIHWRINAGTALINGWTTNTLCREVWRNAGSGLAPATSTPTDIAILQRLLALGRGSAVFSKTYVTSIWNARNNNAALTTLVGAGNGTWDKARLLQWLDYSSRNVNF